MKNKNLLMQANETKKKLREVLNFYVENVGSSYHNEMLSIPYFNTLENGRLDMFFDKEYYDYEKIKNKKNFEKISPYLKGTRFNWLLKIWFKLNSFYELSQQKEV